MLNEGVRSMPGLVTIRSVGRSAARAGIEAAVVAAQELGCRCCIAVVDMAGETVSYDRMDGAPFNSAPNARDKAVSAAGNGTATNDMWAYVANDPQLHLGILKVPGLSVLGGGVPIVLGEERIGAVGVSGDCGMTEDHAIATAGVTAILAAVGDG
jgi:uncharacterized protein GlcG (DUF336 family)